MKNPLLSKLHDFNSSRVHVAFSDLGPEYDGPALVFYKYLDSRPEKFFSKSAFLALLRALRDIDRSYPQALIDYFGENATPINNAFRHAQEINAFTWHDKEVKAENNYHLLTFIDREVHPAYLRLAEAVFQPMLRIVAHFSWLAAGKGTQGLSLYNIVDELPDCHYAAVKEAYIHVVRNGIAHGGVRYSADEIIYWDKRGNEIALTPSNVVRKFDDMLDICNGLLLAYSVFSLSRSGTESLVPQNLMIEDLRAETGTPYWDITGVLPSTTTGDRDQLIIYCNVQTMDEEKVRFSTFQTAVQAERVAPGYERYFIYMSAKNGLPGLAKFGGSELANHRLNDHEIEKYSDVLHDYLPLFLTGRKRLRILNRLETLKYAVQVGWPIILADYRARMGRPEIVVRSASIHRNSWATVLKADVFIEADGQEIDQGIVKDNSRSAIRLANRHARRKLSRFDIARYLPLGFVQINVFCADYRTRRLAGFGLGRDLVGTIRFQRLRRIRSPDILGSTIEIWRGLRFAWNRSWLDR